MIGLHPSPNKSTKELFFDHFQTPKNVNLTKWSWWKFGASSIVPRRFQDIEIWSHNLKPGSTTSWTSLNWFHSKGKKWCHDGAKNYGAWIPKGFTSALFHQKWRLSSPWFFGSPTICSSRANTLNGIACGGQSHIFHPFAREGDHGEDRWCDHHLGYHSRPPWDGLQEYWCHYLRLALWRCGCSSPRWGQGW